MPQPQDIALFMLASLLLNITPGPDLLFIFASSISGGRRAGIAAALGISAGCLLHIAVVSLGLAEVLQRVPLAYSVVKYCGAAYLIYLGLRTLLAHGPHPSAGEGHEAEMPQPSQLRRAFLRGMLTNALNPKVALFFLAFLPQFADASRGNIAMQLALLGSLFLISGTIVGCLAAVLAAGAGTALRARLDSRWLTRWLPGGLFTLLGLRLALDRR